MKTMFLASAAVLCVYISIASAQTVSQPTDDEIVAACEKRYKAPIAREFCIQSAKLVLLEQRLKRGETTLKAEVERLKRELEASAARTPNPPRSPIAEGGRTRPPVGYVGIPHQVVPAPGQYAAATFDPGGPRLDLHSLALGSQTHALGATQVRVVVRKNGVPIPVANADPAQPWGVFYADLDGDGRPDRAPYRGVDPLLYDDVFIGLVGPRDRIELIWLVDSGKRVLVPGLPPEILWARSQRVEYKAPDVIGRWRQAAYGGWSL